MAKSSDCVQVKPGWIVKDVSSASGGVKYNRHYIDEKIEGPTPDRQRLEARFETQKVVDNIKWVKEVDSLVKEVDYILRKHCARTVFGWFAPDDKLDAIRTDVERLREQAEDVNLSAAKFGSHRRAYIGIVPTRVDVSTPEVASEVARTVRETLTEIRDVLRVGEIGQELAGRLLRARNLDQLAVGMQASAITFALENIAGAKATIRERLRKGDKALDIGAELNLDAIENAISLFDPLPFTPSVAVEG